MKRRNFLGHVAAAPLILTSPLPVLRQKPDSSNGRIQYSVNAYSFNQKLRNGEMDFFEMMEFAAGAGLDAVDLTGYYFSSYPKTPSKEELFKLKHKALELGLDIPWTGIRNDFVTSDAAAREESREMIRQWLKASSLLGATIMRIFTGKGDHQNESREEVKERMVKDYQTCARYAEDNGVILGLQHHREFLHTADEVIEILERVDSKWFGLILDVGSLDSDDPYREIRKLAPYANYWFVKEHVYQNGNRIPVDMKKIAEILKETGYRGYVSFESLSDSDPKEMIGEMLKSLQKEL